MIGMLSVLAIVGNSTKIDPLEFYNVTSERSLDIDESYSGIVVVPCFWTRGGLSFNVQEEVFDPSTKLNSAILHIYFNASNIPPDFNSEINIRFVFYGGKDEFNSRQYYVGTLYAKPTVNYQVSFDPPSQWIYVDLKKLFEKCQSKQFSYFIVDIQVISDTLEKMVSERDPVVTKTDDAKHMPILAVYYGLKFLSNIMLDAESTADLIPKIKQDREPVMSYEYEKCRLVEFYLNFDNFEWGKYVVTPRGFYMNYCSGTCGFSLSNYQRPTIHSQFLCHFGTLDSEFLANNFPPPSCIPYEFTHIDVLLTDGAGNHFLHRYYSASVTKCACR